MYETFEHTADLGLRIRAADFDTLFAEAGQALFSVIVDNVDAVAPKQQHEVRLSPDDREYLLFDWLRELLYRFDADHMLFSRFEVHLGDDGLVGRAWGETLDPARHVLGHEVKAITYHGLRVEKVGEQWEAEVIVDI
jgi:SHS2 domain-containing protein